MTPQDPPPQAGSGTPAYAGDLDQAQALIDVARVTAVPGGTRAYCTIYLPLPSTEAVDAAAAQWGASAAWAQDGSQYRAELGEPGLTSLTAGYHPGTPRPVTR